MTGDLPMLRDTLQIVAPHGRRASMTRASTSDRVAIPGASTLDLSIIICTLDRHKGLVRAVRSCLEQYTPTNLTYEIVIVDNSATADARELVLRLWGDRPNLVRYISEPRTNISHARNAGIANAVGRYIAFMDDDMAAPPDWLANAFETMEHTQADVLIGRVVPEFEGGAGWGGARPDCAQWFGRTLALSDGSVIPVKRDGHIRRAGTGNCVLRRASTVHGPVPFDPAFGRTGGEDTEFLQRLGRRGAVTVFSQRAWMTEFIPADRNTPDYLIRRQYCDGQQFVRIVVKNSPRRRLTACKHMGIGAVQLALALPRYAAAKLIGADPLRARIAAAAALGKILWMHHQSTRPYR